jgi:murein DD-endopeptidase MepM/ murein hydrolase activator NlpD
MEHSGKNKKKSLLSFIFNSYNLVESNKSSLKESLLVSFKGYQFLFFTAYMFVFVFGLMFLVTAYGPLGNLLPQTHLAQKKEIIEIIAAVDSLENELLLKSKYLTTLRNSINGIHSDSIPEFTNNNSEVIKKINNATSKEDSILRKLVESEDLYNINPSENLNSSLESFIFFQPIKGIVTDNFNSTEEHYGVDVVSVKDQPVKATLDGVVLFADWSIESGHVIIIQHVENIVSVYMHNATLTKGVNDLVKSGEVIGVVGNSGELSSGPHLHFELWQNGRAIDPLEYIEF